MYLSMMNIYSSNNKLVVHSSLQAQLFTINEAPVIKTELLNTDEDKEISEFNRSRPSRLNFNQFLSFFILVFSKILVVAFCF